MFRDVMRQAALQGLPFEGPPGHPFNPLLPLRMCSAVADEAARRALMRGLMACCWQTGGDITDPATASAVADACGLNGAALLDAAGSANIKLQLAAATTEAVASDIFGVPTFRIGNELFWGGDRLDALLAHLAGQRIDETKLMRMMARPGSAHRKKT
jgi:2-hydroxychromene-2-carboxylate isomerase